MRVTAEIMGSETQELELRANATYGDLLGAVGLSPHEATVLVDGRPVPNDGAIDTEHVRVLRLIKGG
ncbi:ubiquitin-like small modifier protein SAMP2 [Halocatena pleomorpha]|uniref:MoaD/ThiS family protein n=1 Tax=Halocatena pleomorpha TaxID=1785090 RepID=A0A3P3R6N1_9EURY|nr:ubiquitin-like small modifier protein 2 [Halocatena pleomorpha]RRJ28569.1 MoaD/ThiS family protein [Halocatena pleomorpha]